MRQPVSLASTVARKPDLQLQSSCRVVSWLDGSEAEACCQRRILRKGVRVTNLFAGFYFWVSNLTAFASFDAEPWTYYRWERRAVPSVNTNWFAAAYHEDTPYHMPVVLCDAAMFSDAWYRLRRLPVQR